MLLIRSSTATSLFTRNINTYYTELMFHSARLAVGSSNAPSLGTLGV